MDFSKEFKKNIIYILRQLQNEKQNNITENNNDTQSQQLKELYIYIAALVALIIIILGGYAIYRKCVEKKALQEIEREYELMIFNLLNSMSSQSFSQQDKHPHSFNNINQQNIHNFENGLGSENINNSFDYNPEERMENIRKKFGNSLVIKCLLKKQIEVILYTKNLFGEYGDNCTICMENFIDQVLISKTPCEHIFHKKCFDIYLKEIQKKDKLLCPNCNQNLLINKKYLKLRAKSNKIEVKNLKINKREIKESELNLENRNSVVTVKNEDNLSKEHKNEIIFLKRKYSKKNDKNIKIINMKRKNDSDIYNPLAIKINQNEHDIKNNNPIIPNNNKKENDEEDKNKKRNIIIDSFDKKNNSMRINLNINESKTKLYNKRKKLNINDVNSERENIFLSKKTCAPFISSPKEDRKTITLCSN